MQNKAMTPADNPRADDVDERGYSRIVAMANRLGISPRTIREWIKAGKIPGPIDVNGIKLFKNAEIQDWLDAKKEG